MKTEHFRWMIIEAGEITGVREDVYYSDVDDDDDNIDDIDKELAARIRQTIRELVRDDDSDSIKPVMAGN